MATATDRTTHHHANPSWTFADRLRKVRREVAHLTQEKMAMELTVGDKAYSAWESGKNNPSATDMVELAKRIAFRWRGEVTAAWMLGVADDDQTPPPAGSDGPNSDDIPSRTENNQPGDWESPSTVTHLPRRRANFPAPVGDAAKILGVTVPTVRNYERQGRIEAQRVPGGHRRFRRADVEALLTSEATA